MKLRIQYGLVLAVFAGIIISSCVKKPTYPSEPVIAYNNFLRYGNPANPDSVELVISFTDNEGDIGLEQSDTLEPFYHLGNVFMVYFYDSSGTWAAYDPNPAPPFDTVMITYRVPPVLKEGDKAQPMKGLIYVKQTKPVAAHNKIRYDVYMYDKAKHKSNRIITPAITFP